MKSSETLRAAVRKRYAAVAARLGAEPCCTAEMVRSGACHPAAALYSSSDTACLPREAVLSSSGCGNPTAVVDLKPGEIVLDLGSGGGLDVLLSARRVGPAGKVYGLDMTPEMVTLAGENVRRAGAENVELLSGEIEAIPLPDASVDVIVSNCVVNLSTDKPRALREAFRVLKPGGRLAVTDVIVRSELPAPVRHSQKLWVSCVAGALSEAEFMQLLKTVGFEEVSIKPIRVYRLDDTRALLQGVGFDDEVLARQIGGRAMGALVGARKPSSLVPALTTRGR